MWGACTTQDTRYGQFMVNNYIIYCTPDCLLGIQGAVQTMAQWIFEYGRQGEWQSERQ